MVDMDGDMDIDVNGMKADVHYHVGRNLLTRPEKPGNLLWLP